MASDRKTFEFMGAQIEWHDSLGSTNDRACEMARTEGKEAHGWIVGADEQTSGRGRKGSEWISEPGVGLAFSMIVAPCWERSRWGWLSMTAALAVCEGALLPHGLEPRIKWPNDLLIEGRKVCGILIETVGDLAVVGVGLNVNEHRMAPELAAVSMYELLGMETGRELLMGGIWSRMMDLILLEVSQIAERAWDRLAWKDTEVETASGELGRIRGFGENAELNVETSNRLVMLSDADGIRLSGGGE